ncbi:MAG TPA: hypothetical protein VLF89_08880 [Candidatus Saccharimonadales bacterium]|nr:hypothetical protein [Candidatus Saccharimonadales bacterium]
MITENKSGYMHQKFSRRGFIEGTVLTVFAINSGVMLNACDSPTPPTKEDYEGNENKLDPLKAAASVLIMGTGKNSNIWGHGGIVKTEKGFWLISVDHVTSATLSQKDKTDQLEQTFLFPGTGKIGTTLQLEWSAIQGTEIVKDSQKSDAIVEADLPVAKIPHLNEAINSGKIRPLSIVPYSDLSENSRVAVIRPDSGALIYGTVNHKSDTDLNRGVTYTIPIEKDNQEICQGMSGGLVLVVGEDNKLTGKVCGVLDEIIGEWYDVDPKCSSNQFKIIPFQRSSSLV